MKLYKQRKRKMSCLGTTTMGEEIAPEFELAVVLLLGYVEIAACFELGSLELIALSSSLPQLS